MVDPICLSCNLCECPETCCCEPTCCIPRPICDRIDGSFECVQPHKVVLITLGLFSIVQLERSVQMMVPVYDYSVPDKECVSTSDDPCEMFKRIKFPVNEFFPPRLADMDCEDIPTAEEC